MKIKEKRYVARDFAGFNDEKAKEFGEYLEARKIDLTNYKAIYEDAAKNEGSPFYKELEWNNSLAANEHRLSQIKELVEHISIEIIYENEEKTILPRAFELVSRYNDQPRELIGILEGLSEEDSKKQILSRAFQNLMGWWNTYQIYKEFGSLKSPIEEIRNELTNRNIVNS